MSAPAPASSSTGPQQSDRPTPSGTPSGSAGPSNSSSHSASGTGTDNSRDRTTSTPTLTNLYEILNVRTDATNVELKAAYRQLSQKFHPDKHVTESAKAKATDHFMRVKEAYEILSSEKLRRVYNEFGLDAARSAASPELDLVPYSELAQRFRSDQWNEKDGNGHGRDSGKDAYFTVSNSVEPRIDATGLLIALEDSLFGLHTSTPFAAVTQVGLSSNATAYVSQRDTLALRYSLAGYGSASRVRSDPGAGDLELSWRRQLDSYTHVDASVQCPVDSIADIGGSSPPVISVKAYRSLTKDMSMSCESTMNGPGEEVTTALSAARSFSERCSASVSWAVGARGGYAFTWVRNAYDEYISESSEQESGDELGGFGDDNDDDIEDMEEEEILEGNGNNNDNTLVRQRKVKLRPYRTIKWLLRKLKRLIEPTGFRWTARMNGGDISLSAVARRPVGESAPLFGKCKTIGPEGSHVKLSGVIGMIGWEVKAGAGRRFVMADSEIGTSLGFGTVGIVWRIKAKRGAHQLSLPIILQSRYIDTRTAILASLLWTVVTSTVELAIIAPWRNRIEARQRADASEARREELLRAKEEAEATKALMLVEVQRKREAENAVPIDNLIEEAGSTATADIPAGGGLLIERAVYGWIKKVRVARFTDARVDGREIEMEIIEVGDAVQALVDKSTLQMVSRTKCTLSGFWDPSAYGEKEELALKIWYRFRGDFHECIIRDDEPIELPLSSHRVQKWN